MLNETRVLFGIITKSHTKLSLEEMTGLQELGYTCASFEYGAKKNISSKLGRLYVLIANAIKLLIVTHKFKPNFIYLNSRVEYVACIRDFLTIFLVKTFYYKKVSFIIKSHGSDLEVLKETKFLFSKIAIPFLKKKVSGWLFLSTEELRWILSNRLIDENKLFLTKNIVDANKFQIDFNFKQHNNIQNDKKVLLFVGRLIAGKGIHYVIDAFAIIIQKYKIVLIIVGDGEELDSAKLKVKSLKIENSVIFTGWIEEEKVSYYTANSDVLIFPTFCSEGFAMALFNSAAAGLAILTTPVRAAIDYLEEPNNCIWVEPKDTTSIVTAVDRLFTDDGLMKDMRRNNKHLAQFFSREVVSKELACILSSIQSGEHVNEFIQVKNNHIKNSISV